MFKGIIPIFAVILLAVITVGIVSIAYYGLRSITSTSQEEIGIGIKHQFDVMSADLKIDVFGNCKIYLRNRGTKDVPLDIINFYADNKPTIHTPTTGIIKRNAVQEINFSNLSSGKYKLIVKIYGKTMDWGYLTCNLISGFWNFDEGSGNTVSDSSGNGNDGIIPTIIIDEFTNGENWTENQITGSASGGNYVAQITSTSDPFFYKNIADFDESYDHLIFRYKNYVNGSTAIGVYYTDNTDCSSFSETCVQHNIPIISDWNWHTLEAKITDPEWVDNDGTIDNIRFDFEGASSTGTAYVDYIKFRKGPDWTEGKYGKALKFDGVDDYVEVPDSASLDFTHKSITITLWVKTTHTVESWHNLVIKDAGHCDAGTRGVILTYYNGLPGISSGDCSVLEGDYINDGNWHFVAGQVEDHGNGTVTQRVFVDGVLSNQWTGTGRRIENDSCNIQIPDHLFNGIIDEVRIWNKALSAEEISDLYNR